MFAVLTMGPEMSHGQWLLVTLTADGDVVVDHQHMTLAQLTAQLEAEPQPTKTVVTIAGAKTASLQSLMAVMDACRKAGVSQIGVAAKAVH